MQLARFNLLPKATAAFDLPIIVAVKIGKQHDSQT
jgi:hypothetical protein